MPDEGKQAKKNSFAGLFGVSERFAILNRLITRDLNRRQSASVNPLHNKDDIQKYLQNPATYEKQLRQAVNYIYGASSHFRRLISYFVSLSDLSYVVSPYRIDPASANKKSINRNYRRVLNLLSSMSVRTQFPKILTVCLREDVFYGTMWITADNITIQQLPSDYCAISTIEGNVFNVTFDFSYFTSREQSLECYPEEFRRKYDAYKSGNAPRYQEMDAPYSFAIKCNNDILDYAIPPFAGILREIYDIEDYKQLRMTKTALENYAMLVMVLENDDEDGNWEMELERATQFYENMNAVLPEEVGSVLSPMPINKISFERTNTAQTNAVADAEDDLFSAAGVSSLLFNNPKASANALNLSIKADQAITFGVVKSIEDMVNRFVQAQSYGKNFRVTFLDCSPFNRKEVGDMYLKACQYGLPFISMYAASQGLSQSEVDCMSYLETDVLNLVDSFKPLHSSATESSGGKGATDEGGAPRKDDTDLSESGEKTREAE